jgi:TRAP-type C4-dicarboxylate transport system permease small subunit
MRAVRRGLDLLYAGAAFLAAVSLLGIFVTMMAQVVTRELGRQLAGADDLTAYLCVATTFFALAATFKRGELIRVGMAVERLGARARRAVEALVLAFAAVIIGTIVWWTAQDTLFSHEIEEVAQGTVPFPLWIPKLAMPLGAGLLLVAILDELCRVVAGHKPAYVAASEDRAARGDFSGEV